MTSATIDEAPRSPTADVLPVFAGGLLETATRALERGPVDRWIDREVRQGVALFAQMRSNLRWAREAAADELVRGVEGRSFAARYQPLARLLDDFFAAVSLARVALARLGARRGTDDPAPELASGAALAEGEGVALRELLRVVLDKATAPLSIDPERLKQAEDDVAGGRLVKLDDLFEEAPGGA
jgi:hypothetical protein